MGTQSPFGRPKQPNGRDAKGGSDVQWAGINPDEDILPAQVVQPVLQGSAHLSS
jgi:hypothetical protein